jgi:hypothetical protein
VKFLGGEEEIVLFIYQYMNDKQVFIIDKILNIKIDPNNQYNNEFNALMQLKTGMIALYNNVKSIEIKILQQTQ